eukprot:scaffold386872_cov15-Prasinocladus_malaysianus.AAC.1
MGPTLASVGLMGLTSSRARDSDCLIFCSLRASVRSRPAGGDTVIVSETDRSSGKRHPDR